MSATICLLSLLSSFSYLSFPSYLSDMVLCTVKTWFSHDPPFNAGESCIFCGQDPPGPSEIDSPVITERQAIAPPLGPPSAPLTTASAPSDFLSSARLAIDTARASRASAITVATSNTPLALNPLKNKGKGGGRQDRQ